MSRVNTYSRRIGCWHCWQVTSRRHSIRMDRATGLAVGRYCCAAVGAGAGDCAVGAGTRSAGACRSGVVVAVAASVVNETDISTQFNHLLRQSSRRTALCYVHGDNSITNRQTLFTLQILPPDETNHMTSMDMETIPHNTNKMPQNSCSKLTIRRPRPQRRRNHVAMFVLQSGCEFVINCPNMV